MLPLITAWNSNAWYLCIGLTAVVMVHIHRENLTRAYLAFSVFLPCATLQSFALLPLPNASLTYGHVWAFTEPVLMALQIWMVLEIFYATAGHYPSMDFRHQSLAAIAVLSAAACVAIVKSGGVLEAAHLPVRTVILVKTYISWVLVAMLLLSAAFFASMGAPVKRNLTTHRWITTAYIGSAAVAHLLFVRYGLPILPFARAVELTIACACLILWLWKLRADGEAAVPLAPTTDTLSELERNSETRTAEFKAAVSAALGDRDNRIKHFEF